MQLAMCLVMKFSFAHIEAKIQLFKSYCYPIYGCALWRHSYQNSIRKLTVSKVTHSSVLLASSGIYAVTSGIYAVTSGIYAVTSGIYVVTSGIYAVTSGICSDKWQVCCDRWHI